MKKMLDARCWMLEHYSFVILDLSFVICHCKEIKRYFFNDK